MRANMPMEHGQNGAAGCDSEDQNVLRKTLKKKPTMFRTVGVYWSSADQTKFMKSKGSTVIIGYKNCFSTL